MHRMSAHPAVSAMPAARGVIVRAVQILDREVEDIDTIDDELVWAAVGRAIDEHTTEVGRRAVRLAQFMNGE
jgi:hypothetical protein